MNLTALKSIVESVRANPVARKLLRLTQVTFVIGVFYYLALRVSAIGWQDVQDALPTTPWFYALFLAWYFVFPLTEWLVYQKLWGPAARRRFDVFLRMRIYNFGVMSYTGEAYLALWGSQNTGLKKRKIIATVKDSQILSALSSNSLTISLVAVLFVSGELSLITGADPSYPLYVTIAVTLGVILIPLVLRFRRQILSIAGRTARTIFLMHFARLIAVVGLQVAMWSVVMPYVPMQTWLLFLTAQYVLTRIPFLPNADLLFAGLGLTLLSYVNAPHAVLAGIFVASGALSQILNLGLFAGLSLRDMVRRTPRTAPDLLDPPAPAKQPV